MEKLALSINGTNITGGGGAPTGGNTKLETILQVGISYLYIGAIVLALFFLIWGGISWITSEGDKQKLAQARQKIVFAIIGLVIAFLAFLIINIISNFFGVNLLTPTGGGGAGAPRRP